MIYDSLGAKPLLVNLILEVLEVCNVAVQGFIVNMYSYFIVYDLNIFY